MIITLVTVGAFHAGPIFLFRAFATEVPRLIAVAADDKIHVARLIAIRGLVTLLANFRVSMGVFYISSGRG